MTECVALTRALDESQAHVGPLRPHASFGLATGQPVAELPAGAPRQISTAWELRHLQRRSRDVLRHKLVLDPTAPVLRRLGHELLSNIRRIQYLERMADAAGEPRDRVVPLIHDLIRASHHLLDVIVGQIALCDSTTREALTVAEWGRRLTLQEPIKLYKLLPLFDRVCDEIRRTRDLRLLVPLPGLHLTSVIESQSGQADAANFTSGLLTARVLVWMLGDGQRSTQDLARLVLAALMQDVGRLPVVPGGASARTLRGQRLDWLEQQHPTIAAALLGSIRGAPIEFPMLVAQHHEQLDGGGFPRGLAAGDILADAAILAAAGRFAE
ncbi:MAG TPA: HD domain-containing phosphohydrolase, partial [Planctomycetaceae bacterium]